VSPARRAEQRLGWLLCAPAALVMLAVTVWPLGYALWLSLQRYDLRFPDQRHFVGLSNYGTVLGDGYWWQALAITAAITAVSVTFELAFGMALAVVMHQTIFGRALVRTAVLLPYGIVTVVAAFSWRYAWTPGTGWLAGLFGDGAPLTHTPSALAIIVLAEVWKTTPFMALLLLAGLSQVPADVLKAASMDGASPWARFRYVTLPAMRPAIVVAVLFRTLDAFRLFDHVFVLTKGAGGTRTVSMLAWDNLIKGLNLGIGATLSVLIFIVVAALAAIFIKGLGAATPQTEPKR
jgi:multiple sugar transport system permease protein